jgi:transposase
MKGCAGHRRHGQKRLLCFRRSTSEEFEVLRVLMSNRDVIVKRLVSATNQIHRWIDIVFPELRKVYKHIPSPGALATLRLFPTPSDLCDLQP